jgi:methyl-accepting chemotaxis protein
MMAMLERSAKDSVATADAAKQIAQTTQQQQSASQQVAGAARNISLSIDEFFVSAQSTAKVIDEIERLVESLKDKIAS